MVSTVLDEFGAKSGEATGYTDSNGFYNFHVNVIFFVARIEVSCRTPRGVVTSSLSPPTIGPEVVRRDAYLDGPKRLSFTTCLAPLGLD